MNKTIAIITTLALLAVISAIAQFLSPANQPPSVQLAWNASPTPGVTNYNIYEGTNSGQYTSKQAVGTNLTGTVTNLTRGVECYFNVTSQANGLESTFAGEINYTPPLPPAPPAGFKPIVVLTVQNSPTLNPANWTTIDSVSLAANAPAGFFRTKLIPGQ